MTGEALMWRLMAEIRDTGIEVTIDPEDGAPGEVTALLASMRHRLAQHADAFGESSPGDALDRDAAVLALLLLSLEATEAVA